VTTALPNPSQASIGDRLAEYQAGFNILGRLTVLQGGRAKTNKPLLLNSSSRLVSFADAPNSGDDASIYYSFDLPSTGAIEYIRNLTPVTKDLFDGLTRQYRNDAITVAGVNDQRIIQKVRDALGVVVTEGGTPADFRKIVNHITDEAGAARLSAFEIDTVFNTNVQKAYSTGRYEQMNDDSVLDALPFWQYWTVGDDRVRPEHAALDEFVARAIDPVWHKIYPPCGFNCRCSAVPITEEEALQIDKNAGDDGLLRLPAIAIIKVPQPGFHNILAAAA
jgi:SPP1 gp7 family putative phage head morphogenesis protein